MTEVKPPPYNAPLDLDAIEALFGEQDPKEPYISQLNHFQLTGLAESVPALIAEARRLRAELEESQVALRKQRGMSRWLATRA